MLIYPTADPAAMASSLGPHDIHLWVASMFLPEPRVAELARLLDPDEATRAARFRFDIHRRRFTVGRGFQRHVLGAYLGRRPESLVYTHGPKDKPYLAPGESPEPLFFNLSNSEELAILGITRRCEIGVDVEHLRELSDLEALAERFFSAAESRVLLPLPESQHIEAFFNCWTRKEAYLKAVGTGLSAPLDRFDVNLLPGEPPRMLALEGDTERAARWSLHHLVPAHGYLGAIAIEALGLSISTWSWELP